MGLTPVWNQIAEKMTLLKRCAFNELNLQGMYYKNYNKIGTMCLNFLDI